MPEFVAETAAPKAPEVQLDTVSRVNFASAQNSVAVIKSVVLRNPGPEPLQQVGVSVTSAPPIFREKSWTIDRIASEGEVTLTDLATPLDPVRLGALDEAEHGQLELRIEIGGEVVHVETRQIEMLARDEWGGVGDMAQLLAAFVSPNDPVVAGLLKDASRLLEATGRDGSIDGYQSGDPGRVWMLVGALWSAATAKGLSYAVPPASFELVGQKVRGPERIAAEGLATCLDSALLLAAAFEAAGLHPAVLFAEGHAWVGVWLLERDFGHVVEPDAVSVRKAIAAREFVALETTLVTKRPSIGLEEAAEHGRRRLSQEREADFVMAVDIGRARAARIRPMASHRVTAAFPQEAPQEASAAALPRPLDYGLMPGERVEEMPATPLGRIERWQRKLLDLTLMNRLLNFKDSKQTVPFLCPDVPALEDTLADGKAFRALALRDEDPVGRRILSPEELAAVEEDVARDALAQGQIAVPLTRKEMDARLLTLFRKAKSDMAEGGTNTLFLACGFLRWKKSEGDSRIYRAPILLLPIRLERRSAQSEFRILHHEDDVRINSTLLEFLKRDFELRLPELEGELPCDESGIDVPLILQTMRQRVRDVAGFEVVEELALSTFSFAKYLMWKDLVDRTDQLRQSPLVAHLVDNPTLAFPGHDAAAIRPQDLDRRITPGELVTPLPADSSQLAAVVAATEGRDFVLIGPPGTGKSQTIANVIANCLASGRTVLFVAEKAAALNVVHRRLEAQGLGEAVLELHSNKTDRKSVLTQLGRGWDRASRSDGAAWEDVSEKLRVTRDGLNLYVSSLHRKGSQGFSVFEAIGRLAAGAPPLALSFANKDAHDSQSYRRLVDLADRLARTHAVAATGAALDLVDADDWSFGWQSTFIAAAERLEGAVESLRKALGEAGHRLGLAPDAAGSSERRVALGPLLRRVSGGAVDLSQVPQLSASELHAARAALAEAQAEAADARHRLVATYGADAIDRAPLDQLEIEWRAAHARIWPFSALGRKRVRAVLQSYAEGGRSDAGSDLVALQRLRSARVKLAGSALAAIPEVKGEAADLDLLDKLIEAGLAHRTNVAALLAEGGEPARLGQIQAALAALQPGPERQALSRLLEAEKAMLAAEGAFVAAGGRRPEAASLAALADDLQALLQQQARLADWTRWLAASREAEAAGLAPLVEALGAGMLDRSAAQAFEAAYAAWWLPRAMDASEPLRRFAHWEHEDLIATFRALDDKAAHLAPSEVLRRISHGLPARDGVPRKSELGALRYQLGLQRPSMPIRTLLGELSGSFGKLAPCVLMSPLSVAQYLPAGQPAFDVVIFDEASQITTWDAVGAIARARQAIIVGDPKQMPPSNFFGRTDSEEDLPEIERDLPSILDEVTAAGIPTRRLDWHYRSRDEALIAFSNHFYYGGGLVTFPGPGAANEALVLHQVAGRFDRGKSRTNETEAKAVAAHTTRRLTEWLDHPEDARPTLGVITFNQPQQSLIQDLLDDACRKDPRLEWFFAEDREEPVIVKNLENIQGDERDVMLFSVTYAPDAAGKLAMIFGTLNHDGGEKRLNVAITRARAEMHVFTALNAHDIDLTRTRARGVADFKAFLDYADRGAVALPARDDGSLGPAESPFEEAVAEALMARGWEVRTQIGVSGFRIDLAVIDPDHPGAYLAGIECDGATYHASATARDRDKIRQAVLEGLGWNILRIWSTDWFRNPADVLRRTEAGLGELLQASQARRAEREARAADEEPQAADPDLRLALPGPAPTEAPQSDGEPDDQAAETGSDAESELAARLVATLEERSKERQDFSAHAAAAGLPPQVAVEPAGEIAQPVRDGVTGPDPAAFFEDFYLPELQDLVAEIIAAEAPLTLHALGRKISHLHGWQRTGRRILARVRQALGGAEVHIDLETEFVWASGTYARRIPPRPLGGRALREVPPAEVAELERTHSSALLESDDPILELARLMGVQRVSGDAREYLGACIHLGRDPEREE